MSDVGNVADEAVQRPRFGPLREVPPPEVVATLSGAAFQSSWTATRMGVDGGFPNGGLWRVQADQLRSDRPASVVVKRTGPAYLGTFRAWRCRADPADPQWWGREAAFYESALATFGWSTGVRAAWCHVDDHDSGRDLWLEDLADIPASLERCRRAVVGLAHWQVANAAHRGRLPDDWIPTHVGRQDLDNDRTLAHPAWPLAIERGLDPALREYVRTRVTAPTEVRRLLADVPRMLTHHDLHNANIGSAGEEVVLIDWASVGWGPVGHDAGHLALTFEPWESIERAEAWATLVSAYCDGLADAGYQGDFAEVRRSMAISNHVRLGWVIDEVLDAAEQATEETMAGWSRALMFLASLR